MTALDAVRIAWQGTVRRPLRTSLTAASLMIGVLTLVLVQSAHSLVREATTHQAILRAGPATTVRLQLSPDRASDPAQIQDWWLARLRRVTAGTGVRLAEFNTYSTVNLASPAATATSVDLAAVGADLRAIRPFRLVAGSWFTGASIAPQVVLNRPAAAAVAPLTRPSWFELESGQIRVSIVGVVDDGLDAPVGYVSRAAEVTLASAGLRPVVRSILVSAADLNPDGLAARLTTIAQLTGGSGDVSDLSRVDTVGEMNDQLVTQRRLFLGIAVLCLVVGSLGILNIGLSALRERSEELSLRRVVGASRTDLVVIMMLESQIVAQTAAAAAVGGAYLAIPWLLDQMRAVEINSPAPPAAALALGVLASALAALVGAVAPSLRAARVPIADLLR